MIAHSLYDDNHMSDQVTFTKLDDFDFTDMAILEQMCAPFEYKRSAMLYIGKQFAGVVGEYKSSVIQKFKLPQNCSGFELFLSPFMSPPLATYTPLDKFPSTHQDISLRVDSTVSYSNVYDNVVKVLAESASHLKTKLEPQSIYKADGDNQKTITLRVTANNPRGTLKDAEMSELMDAIAIKLAESVGATRI